MTVELTPPRYVTDTGPEGLVRAIPGAVGYFDPRTGLRITNFTVGPHSSVIRGVDHLMVVLSQQSRGQLAVSYDGQTSHGSVRSGMLTMSTPGVDQAYEFDGTTTNTLVEIPRKMLEFVGAAEKGLVAPGALEPQALFRHSETQRLIQRIHDLQSGGALGTSVLAEAAALEVAVHMLSLQSGDRPSVAERALSVAQVDQISEFIDGNMDDDIDLSAMAALLEMDVFAFSRAFKTATGDSPHRFVIARRIERAQQLLVGTQDSLADVAYACGFSSQSHMTSTFAKLVGMPPGKFRREAQT